MAKAPTVQIGPASLEDLHYTAGYALHGGIDPSLQMTGCERRAVPFRAPLRDASRH